MERYTIPAGLASEVCAELGAPVPADRAGVEALYRAWCERFPFDPVAKAAAMVEGRVPPGDDPVEVAERWLTTGVGSTCWGQVAVLGAILEGAGVAVTVGLDRMLTDDLVDFHAFVVAEVDGERLALDPVHPSGHPLPLAGGATGDHGAYGAGFEEVDGRLEHWYRQPDSRHRSGRYAVLSTTLDAADARAFLAVSADHSGVGRRFFVRRCPPDEFVVARPTDDGRALCRTTWRDGGASSVELTELDHAIDAVGYRPAAIDWLRRGALLDLDPAPHWAT